MDYKIAVPSYRRATKCATSTLAYLAECKIDPKRITLFVADDAEAEDYGEVVPSQLYGEMVIGVPGMGAIRNFITGHYPVGQRIVHIDDDIEGLYMATGDGGPKLSKLTRMTELHDFIENAFDITEKSGGRLWGVYPVLNAYFMKTRVTMDLRYIIGCFWGSINSHDGVLNVSLDDKEDVERTLKCYVADGTVARFEYVAPKTNYYNEPGGMQVERTEQRITESAKALVARYPHLCSLNTTKKSGHAEVRLRDKRA